MVLATGIRAPCRQVFTPAASRKPEPAPTKSREELRREKQRLESEPKKVQRQKLMASVADAVRKPPTKLKISAPVVVTEYMTTQEAAAYLKLSRQFLEGARYRGDGSGPTYIKLGTRGALSPVGARRVDVGEHSPLRYADQVSAARGLKFRTALMLKFRSLLIEFFADRDRAFGEDGRLGQVGCACSPSGRCAVSRRNRRTARGRSVDPDGHSSGRSSTCSRRRAVS